MSSFDKSIGGFLGFELPSLRGKLPPEGALLLNSGRACIRMVLEIQRPRRVVAPFYICDAALAPARALNVPIKQYPIDLNLRPVLPELRDGDLILLVDYFGLGTNQSHAGYAKLGTSVLIDQTQALFSAGPSECWRFTSARKWFGVPDGAFLWGPELPPAPPPEPLRNIPMHLIERQWGDKTRAYHEFLEAEARLKPEIGPISTTSLALLGGVDVDMVKVRRRANFMALHERLASNNQLDVELSSSNVPFCYPMLPARLVSKAHLAKSGIFVPTFWQETLRHAGKSFEFENRLSLQLLPLPIDHRYGRTEMDRVADMVLQELERTAQDATT